MRSHFSSDRDDETADALSRGLRDGRRSAQRGMDRLADHAADLRDEAGPMIDRLTERASDAARAGAEWARDSGDRVRERMLRASDRTVTYVRDEPVRAVLMAVAVGTVLFAVARMLSRRDRY
jgi:ElaB/YqjD/DUF883 family membrane-anchored ribosome-binding protein